MKIIELEQDEIVVKQTQLKQHLVLDKRLLAKKQELLIVQKQLCDRFSFYQ